MVDYRLDGLERLICVLEFLGQSQLPQSLKEVEQGTGVPPATLFRLLAALDAHGLVRKNARTRRYLLGPRLFAIGAKRNAVAALRRHTAQFLRRLATEVGGVAQLGSLEGAQVAIDLQVIGIDDFKYSLAPGDYVDAHAVALGKLLLAYCPEAKVSGIFRHRSLMAHTPHTATQLGALRRSFAAIRQQRWAFEEREYDRRLSSLAAPLIAPSGRVNHAIAITTTAAMMSNGRAGILARLNATVDDIQRVVLKR